MIDTRTTVILCGTADTIPSDILELLLTQARQGRGRLMIVDEGSQLTRLHAIQDTDLLLDPAKGNWDFFADHISEHELVCAGEAILRSDGLAPKVFNELTCVLGEMMWNVAGTLGAGLHNLSTKVRAFEYQSLADALGLNLEVPTDIRVGWTALARLQEDAGRFAVATSPPSTSLRRWLIKSPRSVLFLKAGAGVDDGACRSAQAAIDSVSRLEVTAGREVQVVQIHSASGCGTRLRKLPPQASPWRVRTEGHC